MSANGSAGGAGAASSSSAGGTGGGEFFNFAAPTISFDFGANGADSAAPPSGGSAAVPGQQKDPPTTLAAPKAPPSSGGSSYFAFLQQQQQQQQSHHQQQPVTSASGSMAGATGTVAGATGTVLSSPAASVTFSMGTTSNSFAATATTPSARSRGKGKKQRTSTTTAPSAYGATTTPSAFGALLQAATDDDAMEEDAIDHRKPVPQSDAKPAAVVQNQPASFASPPSWHSSSHGQQPILSGAAVPQPSWSAQQHDASSSSSILGQHDGSSSSSSSSSLGQDASPAYAAKQRLQRLLKVELQNNPYVDPHQERTKVHLVSAVVAIIGEALATIYPTYNELRSGNTKIKPLAKYSQCPIEVAPSGYLKDDKPVSPYDNQLSVAEVVDDVALYAYKKGFDIGFLHTLTQEEDQRLTEMSNHIGTLFVTNLKVLWFKSQYFTNQLSAVMASPADIQEAIGRAKGRKKRLVEYLADRRAAAAASAAASAAAPKSVSNETHVSVVKEIGRNAVEMEKVRSKERLSMLQMFVSPGGTKYPPRSARKKRRGSRAQRRRVVNSDLSGDEEVENEGDEEDEQADAPGSTSAKVRSAMKRRRRADDDDSSDDDDTGEDSEEEEEEENVAVAPGIKRRRTSAGNF